MAGEKDYYEVLGVDRGASADAIRKAYRGLAREFHPDVNKSADASTRFAEVQEAYDVLSDAEKRKAYDRFGHAGVGVGQGPGGFGGGGWSAQYSGDPFGGADFTSAFEDLFGARGGGSPFDRAAPGVMPPRRGNDFQHMLSVTFMTAALGGTEIIRIGKGSKPQTISVKIPAGIESGAQLRVRGKGAAGVDGGPSGDLRLTVEIGQHPWFRREGLDVLINVPVTIAEATFGTTVTLPLLKGSVDLKIPPGAASGQKLRVKGKGMDDGKGGHGDFYAVVQVVAPTELTERGTRLLHELEPELQNPRDSGPWSGNAQP